MEVEFAITWLLVSTRPFDEMTMPVPAASPPPSSVVLMSTIGRVDLAGDGGHVGVRALAVRLLARPQLLGGEARGRRGARRRVVEADADADARQETDDQRGEEAGTAPARLRRLGAAAGRRSRTAAARAEGSAGAAAAPRPSPPEPEQQSPVRPRAGPPARNRGSARQEPEASESGASKQGVPESGELVMGPRARRTRVSCRRRARGRARAVRARSQSTFVVVSSTIRSLTETPRPGRLILSIRT